MSGVTPDSVLVDPYATLRAAFPTAARFVWMPNGGNLGDALIAAATAQGFVSHGLPWTLFGEARASIGEGDVLVYGGGGALTEDYSGATECVAGLHTFGRPVVVLPSTVRGHDEFWATLPPTTVFCRDRDSMAVMARFRQHRSLAAHDLALGLRLDAAPFSGIVATRYDLQRCGLLVREPLPAFRGDAERLLDRPDRVDIAASWFPNMADLTHVYSGAVRLLASLASFGAVHTDRLHVAIACGLLGIETTLYPDRNGKLAAVYEMSLRDRFPTLRWAV